MWREAIVAYAVPVPGHRYSLDPPIRYASTSSPEARGFYAGVVKARQTQIRMAIDAALREIKDELSENEIEVARKATDEAVAVIGSTEFEKMPWVGVTDVGTVMVQWQQGDEGVVFSFAGSGIFAMALKNGASSHYAKDYREEALGRSLPDDIHRMMKKLSQNKDASFPG